MATEITPDKKSEVVGAINKYDFRTENEAVFKVEKGINAGIVRQISNLSGCLIFVLKRWKFLRANRCRNGAAI